MGSLIASGALGALGLFPWQAWIALGLGLAAAVATLVFVPLFSRLVLPAVALATAAGIVLGYRAHWDAAGYARGYAAGRASIGEAAARDRLVLDVMNCYATPGYVWDRTERVGEPCKSASGAR